MWCTSALGGTVGIGAEENRLVWGERCVGGVWREQGPGTQGGGGDRGMVTVFVHGAVELEETIVRKHVLWTSAASCGCPLGRSGKLNGMTGCEEHEDNGEDGKDDEADRGGLICGGRVMELGVKHECSVGFSITADGLLTAAENGMSIKTRKELEI